MLLTDYVTHLLSFSFFLSEIYDHGNDLFIFFFYFKALREKRLIKIKGLRFKYILNACVSFANGACIVTLADGESIC